MKNDPQEPFLPTENNFVFHFMESFTNPKTGIWGDKSLLEKGFRLGVCHSKLFCSLFRGKGKMERSPTQRRGQGGVFIFSTKMFLFGISNWCT